MRMRHLAITAILFFTLASATGLGGHSGQPPLSQCRIGPWQPSQCQGCPGVQRRRLKCGQEWVAEERACFSCEAASASKNSTDNAAKRQEAALRPPEALTASFVPYLHVGGWSACQPPAQSPDLSATTVSPDGLRLKRRKKNRKKKKKKKDRKRAKRNGFQLPLPPPSSPPWSPVLPADLEISFVAESVPPPTHGVQRREVHCRGQDGESLPFR